MRSEPAKRVLGGLLIGAVAAAAISAFVAPVGPHGWFGGDPAGTRDDTMSGTVTRAFDSGHARPEAARGNGQDDEPVSAPRSDAPADASPAVAANKGAQVAGSASSAPVKTDRARERHAAGRERFAAAQGSGSGSGSGHGRRAAAGAVAQRGDSGGAQAEADAAVSPQPVRDGQPAGAASLVERQAPVRQAMTQAPEAAGTQAAANIAAETAPQATATQPALPLATQSETPPATPQSTLTQTPPQTPHPQTASTAVDMPAPAPAPAPSTRATPNPGPKTRAEVRAEIVRARGDGSLPAFGNPNPAGPGGAPSMIIPSRP